MEDFGGLDTRNTTVENSEGLPSQRKWVKKLF